MFEAFFKDYIKAFSFKTVTSDGFKVLRQLMGMGGRPCVQGRHVSIVNGNGMPSLLVLRPVHNSSQPSTLNPGQAYFLDYFTDSTPGVGGIDWDLWFYQPGEYVRIDPGSLRCAVRQVTGHARFESHVNQCNCWTGRLQASADNSCNHLQAPTAIPTPCLHPFIPGMPPNVNSYDASLAESAYALAQSWHTSDLMGLGTGSTAGPAKASTTDLDGWSASQVPLLET